MKESQFDQWLIAKDSFDCLNHNYPSNNSEGYVCPMFKYPIVVLEDNKEYYRVPVLEMTEDNAKAFNAEQFMGNKYVIVSECYIMYMKAAGIVEESSMSIAEVIETNITSLELGMENSIYSISENTVGYITPSEYKLLYEASMVKYSEAWWTKLTELARAIENGTTELSEGEIGESEREVGLAVYGVDFNKPYTGKVELLSEN